MRSNDTTTSPAPATAPPDSPVRPPDGTSLPPQRLAKRVRAATSSTDCGNTTAAGAGRCARVQSVPQAARSAGAVDIRSAGKMCSSWASTGAP